MTTFCALPALLFLLLLALPSCVVALGDDGRFISPPKTHQERRLRRLLDIDCSEILVETLVFTGVAITDDAWRRAGQELQPFVDCLPQDIPGMAFIIFNTTQVLRMKKTVIQARGSVMLTSLDAFNERLTTNHAAFDESTMPQFECRSGQRMLQIEDSDVILDHIKIGDCSMEKGSAVWVDGNLTLQNSVVERTEGKRGTTLIQAASKSTISIQNVVFRRNRAIHLIRGYRGERLTISMSTFEDNVARDGEASIALDQFNRLEVRDSVFRRQRGRSLLTKDVTMATLHNCSFKKNNAEDRGSTFTAYGQKEASRVEMEQCECRANRALGDGGCLSFTGRYLDVEIAELVAESNSARRGGVIASQNIARMTIKSSQIAHNTALAQGGFLFSRTKDRPMGSLIMQSSRLTKNFAHSGGGVYIEGPIRTEITSQTFSNNRARKHGGALRVGPRVRLSIVRSTFTSNNATAGGGIYCQGAFGKRKRTSLQFNDVDVSENFAVDGGGLFVSTASVEVANGTAFYRNRADHQGGGIYGINGALMKFTQCDFGFNEAKKGGAISAVDNRFNKLVIQLTSHVILMNNSAELYGGGLHLMGKGVGINTGYPVQFEGNQANRGGGIYYVDGYRFNINGTLFLHNSGRQQGGAVYVQARERRVTLATNDARFVENVAASGGALCLIGPSKEGKAPISVTGRFMNTTRWVRNEAWEEGGGIYSEGSNSLLFNGSLLIENRAEFAGGAVALRQGRTVVGIVRSVFSMNAAMNGDGGAMSIVAPTQAQVRDVNFTRNEALVGGALYIATEIVMQGSEIHFINNSASHTREGGGAIYCEAENGTSRLQFSESQFRGNVATPHGHFLSTPFNTSGGALYLTGPVSLFLYSVEITRNMAYRSGGGLFLEAGSQVSMYNTSAMFNRAGFSGGALFLGNTAAASHIRNSNLTSNAAAYGGALYVANMTSTLKLYQLHFAHNTADQSGGAIHVEDTSLMVNNTQFSHNSVGYVPFNSSLCPERSAYYRSSGSTGGAVHVERAERSEIQVHITHSDFLNNTADEGGSLALSSPSEVNIMYTIFRRNRAHLGGAVLWNLLFTADNSMSSVVETMFLKNTACQGGGIYAIPPSPVHAESPEHRVLLADVQFDDNMAETSGGGLHIPRIPEIFQVCCDCLTNAVMHPLAPALVSSFNEVCPAMDQDNRVGAEGYGPLFSTDSHDLEVTPKEIRHHRSGDILDTIFVRDIDALGQTVPFADLELSVRADGVLLEGENRTHLHDGSAEFDGIVLSAEPGTYTLRVMQENVLINIVVVHVSPCGAGERLDGLLCVECEEGSYTTTAEGGCQRCPDHAVCADGYVLPEDGYWNADLFSVRVLKCVRPQACKEDRVIPFSNLSAAALLTDRCIEGQRGVLCGECEDGYGHVRAQECQECRRAESIMFGVLLMIYLFFISVFLIKTSWVTDYGKAIEPRDQAPQAEVQLTTTTSGSLTLGEGDVEAEPIPEHLEPMASFGIRGQRVKDSRRCSATETRPSTSEDNHHLKVFSSAPTSPTATPRGTSPESDNASSSSSGSRNEITPAIRTAKPHSNHILTIEEVDIISESHFLLKPLLSEALKILLTFFQSASLALYIQIDWSAATEGILRLFSFLGTGSSPYFSLECMFGGADSSGTPASIQSFAFILLAPVVVSTLFLTLWFLVFLLDRSMSLSLLWQRVKNSLVAVFYVFFLPICHTCFRALNCASLIVDPHTSEEKDYVWLEDTSVICYEGAHQHLVLYFCLPLILMTLVLFPISFFVFLCIHKNLGKTERLRSWGLLFEAYKYKRRYWEFTIFVRKTCLAAIFAFGYHFGIQTQTLVAIGVVVFFLLAHSVTSPYEKAERMLSHMETISLFGVFLVYFAACLIHALDEGNGIIFVVLCVVLILVVLRLFYGLMQHLMRSVDWTLGEFGKERYYSKSWITKFCMVRRLKCSFVSTRMQRVFKRWVGCTSNS